MKKTVILLAALASAAAAEVNIHQVKARRRVHKLDKDHEEVFYQFEDGGEHVKAAAQARKRAAQAAEAWKAFEKDTKPVAVLARSPFGGGETSGGYWPEGVKAELLRKVVEPLTRQGLKVVLPDLPPEEDKEAEKKKKDPYGLEDEPEEEEIKPYPKLGFTEDYEFVLVVGLHHEKIPYKGARQAAAGQVIRRYSSRVNAWAILFHGATGSGFWGATSVARAGHGTVPDTLNTAAEAAVGYLDFSGVGEGNLTGFIQQFARREELPRIDVATLLIQSQRADAAAAVMQAAIGKPAFTNTVWVLRWYSDKGTPQDYRIDITDARKQRYVQVNQRVLMRVLLMETLRGMRSVQACVLAAQMPRIDDIEVPEIGRQFVASTGPQFPDDEIVLITELARETPRRRSGLWRKDPVQAVRALGRCAHHIEEAMAVAKVLASRPDPPPRRGKRRRDPIKEAAKAAMRELARAKVERDRKVSEELRRIREALE